ncbi:hypothetical protein ACFVJ5_10705 [Nocardia sp. NPDC127606]|uniref:hypothetical protein n=1 Tax=Nocardia sp. NPDC127606 TaxID=3345406 RepID=UPI003635532F
MSTHRIASAVAVGVTIAFLAAGTAAAEPRSLAPTQLQPGEGAAIAQTGERAAEAIADSDEGGKPEGDAGGKGKGKGKGKGEGQGKGKGKAGGPGEADR